MTMGLNDFNYHWQIGPRCYSRTLSALAFELCLVALSSSRMNLTSHPLIQRLCQLLLG